MFEPGLFGDSLPTRNRKEMSEQLSLFAAAGNAASGDFGSEIAINGVVDEPRERYEMFSVHSGRFILKAGVVELTAAELADSNAWLRSAGLSWRPAGQSRKYVIRR